MAVIDKSTSVGEDVEKWEPFELLVGMQIGWATVESSMEYLKKLKMNLPFYLATLLLGIYPKELKKLTQKNISTCMFIAALFTMAKCPSVDEWIKQLWDIYIIVYFLVIKLKKVLPFATV